MRFSFLTLALAIGCGGNRPAPTIQPAAASTATHHLTVRIRGAGSVVGGVRSQPAGIDCKLESNQGGTNEKECAAELLAGNVTLTFVPGGAGSVAQFSVIRNDVRAMCEDKMASGSCTLDLASDATVEVFPISVPPPPAPR